jgi:hypothetical protein
MKMKPSIIVTFIFLLSGSCSLWSQPLAKPINMQFSINQDKAVLEKKEHLLLKMEFKNTTKETLRLLKIFEPIPVFFSIEISNQNGEYFNPPGAGKASFTTGAFEYINIPPNKTFIKELDVHQVLSEYNIMLETGKYKLKASYHNQYGENCIKGWFTSKEIEFVITRETPKK